MSAADTVAFGELLRDFYRLCPLEVAEAWAVQLLRPAFRRHLEHRLELGWTDSPGTTLVLAPWSPGRRPGVARRARRQWARGEVRAPAFQLWPSRMTF